jgi:hypothetical protein
MPKRVYPFGRVMQDTVAQPFRSREYAELFAEILQRMTGEQCDVIPRHSFNIVVRYAGEKWIRA